MELSSVADWLRSELPADPVGVFTTHDSMLEFRFEDYDCVQWSEGRIVKTLKNAAPDVVIPVLWHLCRVYDNRDETSQDIRYYLKKQADADLEDVPFYLDGKNLLTACCLSGIKPLIGITKTDRNKGSLLALTPTNWLRDLLVNCLVERITCQKSLP